MYSAGGGAGGMRTVVVPKFSSPDFDSPEIVDVALGAVVSGSLE
jgi:hypothetical protein